MIGKIVLRRPLRVLAPVVYLVLSLAGCQKTSTPQASPEATGATVWIANGWTGAERAEFYHLSEGSELVWYDALANVVSVKTGKPFLENMERFGFIADAVSNSNPHGLPIGVTVGHSRNIGHVGLEEVGFNCAGCHVAEMTYKGRRLIVDGAPSRVDLQRYQIELKDSLERLLDPVKMAEFAKSLERSHHTGADSASQDYASDSAAKTAKDVPAVPTADPTFHSTSSRLADATDTVSAVRGQTPLARFRTTVALIKAQVAYLRNGKLLLDGTEPGPGRVDAFGAARNLLFPKDALRMQSPVSFPFVWNVPDTAQEQSSGDAVWIHYDGNTNSILERNIGQALGMGAVYDPKTYESTLRIENLHRLEVLIHKLSAPKWPAETFGPIDQSKANSGEKIFNDLCRDCHQNHLYDLTDVGTDPQRANSFGQPVHSKGGLPFPEAVKPILDGLKVRAFKDDGISAADQENWDVKDVIWRATGKYMARPLAGVWATAPYLHNGSVPTLWHLLHPDQRPANFAMGSREFDPEKVGYSTGGGGWTFDTSQPGNSNIGHVGNKYGTNLTEDQKAALLEYLKSI